MKKNVTMKLVLALMIIFGFSFVERAMAAANNTIATATQIQTGAKISGTLTSYNEVLYYKVVVDSPGKVTLKIENKTNDSVYAYLTDSSGNEILQVRNNYSSSAIGYSTTATGLPKGTYYVKIKSDEFKKYNFSAYVTLEKNAAYETEDNDSIGKADAIIVNKNYKGITSDYYDKDYFKVTTSKDGIISLQVKNIPLARFKFALIDSKGNTVYNSKYSTNASSSATGWKTIEYPLQAGTYYVLIEGDEFKECEYEFKAQFTDVYAEKESNDTSVQATLLAVNKTMIGFHDDYYDQDYYKVNTNGTGYYNIRVVTDHKYSNNSVYRLVFNNKYYYAKTYNGVSEIRAYNVKLNKGVNYIMVDSDYNWVKYSIKVTQAASTAVKAVNVKITNYTTTDTIKMSGLKKGTSYTIYADAAKKKKVTTFTATGISKTVSIKQLGKTAGSVYIVAKTPGYAQSTTTKVSYAKETLPPLAASNVVVTNGISSDKITLKGLTKGNTYTVYADAAKKKKLASYKATASSKTLYVKQVGTKAGYVYVVVSKTGFSSSPVTKVAFKAQPRK